MLPQVELDHDTEWLSNSENNDFFSKSSLMLADYVSMKFVRKSRIDESIRLLQDEKFILLEGRNISYFCDEDKTLEGKFVYLMRCVLDKGKKGAVTVQRFEDNTVLVSYTGGPDIERIVKQPIIVCLDTVPNDVLLRMGFYGVRVR